MVVERVIALDNSPPSRRPGTSILLFAGIILMRIEHIAAVWSIAICSIIMLVGDARADPGNGHAIPDPVQLLPRLLDGWQQLQKWDETEKEYHVDANLKSLSKTEPPQEMLYIIRIKPHSWLCKGKKRTESQGTAIYCQSPFYTFVITNKMDEEKNAWTLGNFDKIESQAGFRQDFFTPLKSDLFYPLTAFGSTVLHLITKQGGFSVTGVRGGENGKLLVDFAYSIKGQQERTVNLTGQMVVDPNRSYVVLESRRVSSFNPEREFIVKRDIEESPDAPGGFRCKSYDFTIVNRSAPQAGPMARYQHAYHDYSYKSIPDEVFRLSGYGLPESLDSPPVNVFRLTPWLWIALTAVALVGAAVALRKLTRRT